METQPTTKPKVRLTGTDGNVFVLLGRCTKALKANGMRDQAEALAGEVFATGSYDEALQAMMSYVDAS